MKTILRNLTQQNRCENIKTIYRLLEPIDISINRNKIFIQYGIKIINKEKEILN